MGLQYQMELGLGRRARPVVRRFGGLRAWILIGIDLSLALAFGLVGLAFRLIRRAASRTLRLTWYALVALMTLAVEILLSPIRAFRAARHAVARDRHRAAPAPAWSSPTPIGKPRRTWGTIDDLSAL